MSRAAPFQWGEDAFVETGFSSLIQSLPAGLLINALPASIEPNTGIESRKYLCTKPLSALTLQGTFLIWSHSVPLREAAPSTGTALGRPALCWHHLSLPPPLLLFQSIHHVPSK